MEIAFIVSLVLILVGGIVMLFALQRFQTPSNTKVVVTQQMTEIDARTNLSNYDSLRSALIDYDTLLDHVMKDHGIRGENMGQRIKNVRNYLTHKEYNDVWEAHKLRNKFVHEATFKESIDKVDRNRKALKEAIKTLL